MPAARPDWRRDGGVAGIAAVPITLAVDLDCLEHGREARRCEQHVRRDLVVSEHPTAAGPPGQDGWRVVTLSFEHERAAVHRLAGFGDQVEILDPSAVRSALLATAREILGRYQSGG